MFNVLRNISDKSVQVRDITFTDTSIVSSLASGVLGTSINSVLPRRDRRYLLIIEIIICPLPQSKNKSADGYRPT